MRHAFLIIAHNEFEILQRLISQLDSEESDIFVHIDKKVKTLPKLSACKSPIYILPERIDVRWGNVSQIRTELLLLSYAKGKAVESGKQYDYYHMVSGTHLLLCGLGQFDEYFSSKPSAVFTEYYTDDYEIDIKIRRYNLFTRTFSYRAHFIALLSQFGWRLSNNVQKILHIRRYAGESFKKASNWCSLSSDAVEYLLSRKKEILHKYSFSFCADEFFAPTELTKSPFADGIEWKEDYIYTDFGKGSNPKILLNDDFDAIMSSHCLWARKFSSQDMTFINRICSSSNNE